MHPEPDPDAGAEPFPEPGHERRSARHQGPDPIDRDAWAASHRIDGAEVDRLLDRIRDGDERARHDLFVALYESLRFLAQGAMRHQRRAHTLQPTALVNELYLKLSHGSHAWESRSHFLAVAARAMRHLLVDHARTKSRRRRSATGDRREFGRVLEEYGERAIDLAALDLALKRLEIDEPRAARVVELHFFGALSLRDVAAVLGTPLRTVERDWRFARAWLHADLTSP